MPRREDDRLLTGQGRFIDDTGPAGALIGVVLRAPVAHARIATLDVTAAQGAPGVRLVLTAADLAAAGVRPMRSRTPVTSSDGTPMIEPERPVLADGAVKYLGQPVAFVVAETQEQAQDAIELIEAGWDDRPALMCTGLLPANGPPAASPDAADNTSFRWQLGNGDAVDAALAAAAHVVTLTVRHPRLSIAPVETRGAVGEHDAGTGRFTLRAPSQGVIALRDAMSDVLGVDKAMVRVITEDVGGSFAVKIWPYPEHVLCLHAARVLGRPVRWSGTRAEAFVGDAHGRGRVDHATMALDADGRITAFRIDALGDLGAFLHAAGPSIFAAGACRVFGGTYAIPAMHYRVRALFTNTTPTDAYRGAGKPESVGTLERVIDYAAGRLGLDRLELRRRNLVTPDAIPYRTPMNETIDAGDFPGILDATLAAADWAGYPARKAASKARGLARGAGIGMSMHATGGSTAERSEVKALPDGRVRVRPGTQDSGRGHKTALARVAAEALGLGEAAVVVEQGDSDGLTRGGGTGGSNLMPIAANTVHRAARRLIDNARLAAADALEAAVADIEYEAGMLTVAGTDRAISLAELAARLPDPPADQDPGEPHPGCLGLADFEGKHSTYPNGAYVVEVEVDPATGHVRLDRFTGIDDLGRMIDEPSALGQVYGGIAQAVGEVLMEGMVYDAASGQLLSGSLMDYALPRADHMPAFRHAWRPTGSPNSALGVKGVGELPSIGGPGPIANAVLDALGDYGVAHLDIPLTAEKICRAIRDGSTARNR